MRTFCVLLVLSLMVQCGREPMPDDAAAHWVADTWLVWNVPQADGYRIRAEGLTIALTPAEPLPDTLATRYPHLAGWPVFRVDADAKAIHMAIRGRLTAESTDSLSRVTHRSRVQIPGLLDHLYAYDGRLGPRYDTDSIRIAVWAPTSRKLVLNLYDPDQIPIRSVNGRRDHPSAGVWTFALGLDADRHYYRFQNTVYHHQDGRIHDLAVTDPYAVSLSIDGGYSQVVDLARDPLLKPAGWDDLRKTLPRPVDITLYEAHMRDLSMLDTGVPAEHRGTYLALTHPESDVVRHLRALADAGLTHIHLLPVNDIGSVPEDSDQRTDMEAKWDAFERAVAEDPASRIVSDWLTEPNRATGRARTDGFNWGYDPVHFNVPEGSYATDPDGPARIREMREMVLALDAIGLKVVIDVVYNHTYADGMNRFSVLDRMVPGYYHRYNPVSGAVETSTCCFNTAAEHRMMAKLLYDSVELWAVHYKIDAFRFDLMGHHPKSVMQELTRRLSGLTLDNHGVDGSNIYIYGEGWDFGEVAGNRLFEQATQFNMGGTGIGNFNDRLRDAIRGGNFTDRGRFQGFANGQYLFPNEDADPDTGNRKAALLEAADRIRVGLTGNLSTYRYRNRFGEVVDGGHERIGYTRLPQESIQYVDKHDNETLWDNTQTKLPRDMVMDDRLKVHMLSLAFINYSQGVPFHHMGSDILRSKSLDRNSYDSGDWYNAVDFTMRRHGWGKGLPPIWDNGERWEAIASFLKQPSIAVRSGHMRAANEAFRRQLRIRYSSPLFRLETAEDVHRRVAFHNTGTDQVPGLIVMSVSDAACGGADLDPAHDGLMVVFNASLTPMDVRVPVSGLSLHPEYRGDAAMNGSTLTVPPLEAAVFVKVQRGARGAFPCNP
jgi:pullulanase